MISRVSNTPSNRQRNARPQTQLCPCVGCLVGTVQASNVHQQWICAVICLGRQKQGGGKSALDWAAYSMLGKSSVWDILDLIGAGQVPIARIANHVRTLGITSQPVIRLLNLLAPKENAHHKNSKLPRTTPLP